MDGTVLESDQTYVYVILFNPVSKNPSDINVETILPQILPFSSGSLPPL